MCMNKFYCICTISHSLNSLWAVGKTIYLFFFLKFLDLKGKRNPKYFLNLKSMIFLLLCPSVRPSWLWEFEYLNMFLGKLKF